MVKKYSKGFTLIEVLIGTVILGMLGLGLLGLQILLNQNRTIVFTNYQTVDEASSAINQFTKEVRLARISENGAYALEELGDFEIIFYSDIDLDEQTERVRYFLDGTNFSKGVIEPSGFPATYPQSNEKIKVLSENVTNDSTAVFYYYNSDWPTDTTNNPLAAGERLLNTQTIKIYLKVNSNPKDLEKVFEVSASIQPRMLKVNN